MKRALVFLFLQLPVYAQDIESEPTSITTTEGITYSSARIVKVEPDGIRLIHESGSCKVPFSKLPTEIQARYSYDPAKAAQYKKDAAQKEAYNNQAILRAEAEKKALQLKLKSAKRDTFKVFNVLKKDNGLLANFFTPSSSAGSVARAQNSMMGRSNQRTPSYTGETVYLTGNINFSKIVDGSKIEAIYVELGTYEYITTEGAESTVKKLEVLEMGLFE
jgi:hypothetical protein